MASLVRNGGRRNLLSWLSLAVLLLVCGVLGFLQYRWIGEISRAERDRLSAGLRDSLGRLNREFSTEIGAECRTILTTAYAGTPESLRSTLAANVERWRTSTHRPKIFRRIGLLEPNPEGVALYLFHSGAVEHSPLPEEWFAIRERLTQRVPRGAFDGRGERRPMPNDDGLVFVVPLPTEFQREAGRGPFEPPSPLRVAFELDHDYVRSEMLPDLIRRHLGSAGALDYEVAILGRGDPPPVIYESSAGEASRIAQQADIVAAMFEPQVFQVASRGPVPPRERSGDAFGGPFSPYGAPAMRGTEMGPGRAAPGGGPGRWQVFVHHKAGSLDVVVARARARNLAVAAFVLLLMLASAGALFRYTRRAQKLAALQMEFVAGVGHELRTPLTVIRTAAYNLQGKLAQDPVQVEKYGNLISRETNRLTDLVEQVLRFAGSEAGRPVQQSEPVSLDVVLEEAIESSRATIDEARCTVECQVEPDLPGVKGDAAALKRVFENLLSNAAKHGAGEQCWIGVRASGLSGKGGACVEVRVADRGPGIPAREMKHLFEPFVRGERALRDQVHGSGLGLNLVKRIVEAHGGSVYATSVPGERTEFIVRLPAIPPERQK